LPAASATPNSQHDTVKAALDAMRDPIPIRTANILTEAFISFFKRFDDVHSPFPEHRRRAYDEQD
jgi:hypothetical protein